MGQKLCRTTRRRKKRKPPELLRKFLKPKYPQVITLHNLGLKDADRRIVTKVKAIPVTATKDATKKERFRFESWEWIKQQIAKLKSHQFFRTKENTYDEHDDDHDEYEIEITEQNWNRNFYTHLAVYALVISTSNIFRFPQDCYRYGGAVFFSAYAAVTIFIIQPMIYLEMVVGQFSQKGVSGFGALHPFAKGIPQAIIFISLIFVPFNSVVQGYSSKYVYGSFYRDPGDCGGQWNKLNSCVSYDDIRRFSVAPRSRSKPIWLETSTQRTSLISTELYFRQFILHHKWDGHRSDEHAGWNPSVFIGLGFTYLLVFISTRVRLTSIPSRILITLSGLLPILLLGILVSQIFRAGALVGILQLFFLQIPQWAHILTLPFWSQVFRSAFLTSGIGCGLYSRVASKNPFNNESLHRSSWILVLITLTISLTSSLILMAELGALGYLFPNSSYDNIFAEGTGSAFAAVTGALHTLEERAGILIFFAACNICGIWNAIVATENCTSQIVNWFSIATENLQMARYIALAIVIILQAAFATLVSAAGGLVLDSFLFDGTWSAAFVSFAEVVSIAYMYGSEFFMIDIELMLRYSAPPMFKYQLRYSLPIAILAMLLCISYTNIRYGEERYLGIIPIPNYIVNCGFIVNAVPPILIIVLAAFGFSEKARKGLFWFPAIDYLQQIFKRFTHRRAAVFEANEAEIIDMTVDWARRQRQHDRAQCLEQLKIDLTRIRISRRARANWARFTNKTLVSLGRLNTIPRVTNWILRELELKKNRKEVKYITKILASYSMESIFTLPKLAVRKREATKERERLADVLLNSLSLDQLGFKYAKLTLYERLVGKGNPIPEVDKAFMIMRVKKHLGLECRRDEANWLSLLKESEENRKKNSVFRENPPVEFYFSHDNRAIRGIMFKGKDHSILRNTPHPRPPLIEVVQRHIRKRAGRSLWNYLKDLVIKSIEKRKLDSLTINSLTTKPEIFKIQNLNLKAESKGIPDPEAEAIRIEAEAESENSGSDTVAVPANTKIASTRTEKRQLFTPLPHWYHNCDTRPYSITHSNTFFISILDRQALKEMIKDRFAYVLPPEGGIPPRRWEVVAYNTPGVYEETYARLQPFYDKIAREEEELQRKPIEEFTISMPRTISEEITVPKWPLLRSGRTQELKPIGEDAPVEAHAPAFQPFQNRYSEVDIHLLRRLNPVLDSALPVQTRFSESLIASAKKHKLKAKTGRLEDGITADPRLYSDSFESTLAHGKGRRVLEPVDSGDDWIDSQLLKTTWQNSDVELSRTKSELYSEKAMAAWLAEVKGKKKGGLNEEDEFFYRRRGNELLVVEPRNGRQETSTSDTTIFGKRPQTGILKLPNV